MTFKKMKPEEFKVGRRYRTNHKDFSQHIYDVGPLYSMDKCLYREGRFWVSKENDWEWEEVPIKKRIFR